MPCCGGKNAGSPITSNRYLIGQILYLWYTGTVFAILFALSFFVKRFQNVRRFWGLYFPSTFSEIRTQKDIAIVDRPEAVEAAAPCPLEAGPRVIRPTEVGLQWATLDARIQARRRDVLVRFP